MIDSLGKSYVNNYKMMLKVKKTNNKSIKLTKNSLSRKDLRKRWGLKVAGVGLVALGFNSISKFSKHFPMHIKILSSIASGLGLGTGMHFLFTKKSQLKEDNLTNNYGKRLAVITSLAAITGASMGNLILKNTELSKALPLILKAKGVGLFSAAAAVFAAVTYSTVEGVKGIADKSLKKEKAKLNLLSQADYEK